MKRRAETRKYPCYKHNSVLIANWSEEHSVYNVTGYRDYSARTGKLTLAAGRSVRLEWADFTSVTPAS
jgi:hypothetical protein